MKKIFSLRFVVHTAILLALALIWQSLRFVIGSNPVSTYLIGTLVNITLLTATAVAGWLSGGIIAILAPIVALMQGHAQAPMVPWIIAGNLALVLLFAFIHNKNWWVAFTVAAVVKFLIIAAGMTFVTMGKNPNAVFPAAFYTAMGAQIVQLITALIAGIVALPVVTGVKRALKY